MEAKQAEVLLNRMLLKMSQKNPRFTALDGLVIGYARRAVRRAKVLDQTKEALKRFRVGALEMFDHNSDYATGYISAIGAVEGIIAALEIAEEGGIKE